MTADAIPIADEHAFVRAAGRTRLIRVALATGAVAASTIALAAALHEPARSSALLPPGSDGIVVVDLSASVSAGTYRKLSGTLDRLAASGGRYGLVVFSDSAYLALPPRTPASELRPLARLFRVPRQTGGVLPQPPQSPWTSQFSAGTRISTGLAVALDVARAERAGRPAVLLVSDLDDDVADLDPLARVALEYQRAGVALHVVALDAAAEDRRTVSALLARPGNLVAAPDPGERPARAATPRSSLLITAAAATAALLATLLVVGERMRWRISG
jgi:hypothetical protein